MRGDLHYRGQIHDERSQIVKIKINFLDCCIFLIHSVVRYQQRHENNNFGKKISEHGQVSIPLNWHMIVEDYYT